MDPHSVLGLQPDATPEEVGAAYRRLAKRWHPDVAEGDQAAARMAEINAAYDILRGGLAEQSAVPAPAHAAATSPKPRAGAWLDDDIRRALGRELLQSLEDREPVELVTPTSTWASPQTRLALTDRRLLWLLDDAVTHRVRSLRFRDVGEVDQKLSWPRKRCATVRVQTREGRRHAFAELTPSVAQAIVRRIQAARG